MCMRTEEAITTADDKVPGAYSGCHPDVNTESILTINCTFFFSFRGRTGWVFFRATLPVMSCALFMHEDHDCYILYAGYDLQLLLI